MIDAMLQGLSGLIETLISLLAKIMTALISGVVSLSEYSDFVNAAVVVNGWVIVRDVANMFFIIVLLLIAFGTILGQEEYHYKKLLPKMLLLAVLVNFSRTIIGVMIDFSQVIMLTFVNGYKVAAGGNFANLFQITKLMQYKADNCLDPEGLNQKEIFAASLLALAMVVISIVTITVILVILALRIVMLWLLTVLSPIAFLCGTFPQGQEYYAQWWKEFKSQVMVGPVLAFFLWLSLVSIGSGNASNQITRDGVALVPDNPVDGEVVVACSAVGSGSELISYVIGIMMLLTATQMAQQMGGVIAGAAGRAKNAAYKTLKFGAKTMAAPAMFGLGMAGKRAQRGILDWSATESPGKWYKGGLVKRLAKYAAAPQQSFAGFMQRQKRLDEAAQQRAFGASQEDADFIFTGGLWGKRGVKTPWLRLTRDSQREHEVQTLKSLRRQDQVAVGKRLVGKKDILGSKEYTEAREAVWNAMANSGYNDDIALAFKPALIDYAKLIGHNVAPGENPWHDDILVSDFAYAYNSGVDVNNPEEIAKARGHVLDNINKEQSMMSAFAYNEDAAKATGHPEQLGLGGEADENTGLFTGVKKEGWLEKFNEKTGEWDYKPFGKEFDEVIHHGNQRFVSSKERAGYMAYADKNGKEYLHVKWDDKEGAYRSDDGWGFKYRHPDQEKFAMAEVNKFSGQQLMGIRVHGIQSLGDDDAGNSVAPSIKTIQEREITSRMKIASEARRMETRPIEALLQNVTPGEIGKNTAEVIAENAVALRRLIEEIRANPTSLALKLAKDQGLEERAMVAGWGKQGITIKMRQADGTAKAVRVHTWKVPADDRSKVENAADPAAINKAIEQAVQTALSEFSVLGIEKLTSTLSGRQASVIKNQMDAVREAIEKSGKTVDKKITEMFKEMDHLGHQSVGFSNYFRKTFKREDWEKLRKQFE